MIPVDDVGEAYPRIDHSPWNGCGGGGVSEVTDDQAHGQRQIPDNEIPLPNVTNKILGKVIEYCKKHIEANCADEKPNEDELRLGTLISSRLIRPLFSISFWGFTKFSRADYLKYKSESKIVPVGVNVKRLIIA
ncbi:60S ribosomal protein L10 [Glycine soja]